METIKETIAGIMQGLASKKEGGFLNNPEAFLRKALTKKECKHIKFKYFKKGIVGVSVDSSSWLFDFNLKKEHLLAQLCAKTDTIKDIRFHLGEIK